MANLTFIHCYPVDFSHVWLRAMEQLPGLESLVLRKLYATHGTAVNKATANRLETSSVLDSSLAFSALKSLKLHGMRWGLREPTTFWHRSRDVDWPKCIASFMLNARHLAELHLSTLSLECDNMLEAACKEYAARCNDEHLVPLKNLSLAKNMHTPAVSVLHKAFDLSALETIKVSGTEASLKFWGVSADINASMKKSMDELSKQAEIKVSLFYQGSLGKVQEDQGSPSSISSSSAQDAFTQVKKWSDTFLKNACEHDYGY
ncbi:hypothetical protein NHJ6243_006413, partial [Beauveria neobassiana]